MKLALGLPNNTKQLSAVAQARRRGGHNPKILNVQGFFLCFHIFRHEGIGAFHFFFWLKHPFDTHVIPRSAPCLHHHQRQRPW